MGFLQDVQYTLRSLRKNLGFSLIAILALAIGIGANTSIFSLVNTILIRPLPYRDPDRLVLVRERIPKLVPEPIPAAAPHVERFRKENRVFEDVAGYSAERMDLSASGEPRRVSVTRISWNAFPLFGVEASLGRTFNAAEDRPGQHVVILSHGLWKRQFGEDRAILGKTIHLDRLPYTVVGVMPQYFQFPVQGMRFGRPSDVWIPLALTNEEIKTDSDNFNFGVIGRMKPGATLEQVRQDTTRIATGIRDAWGPDLKNIELVTDPIPISEEIVGNVRVALLLLFGAVGLLLLIACANVANLLLSRAASRNREISIRAALGAGRWRVIRQLLTESVVLGCTGGLLGVLLAWWGLDLLSNITAGILPRSTEIRLDWQVLAFSVVLSLGTGIVFGLLPALTASRTDLTLGLRDGGKGMSTGLHRSNTQRALVVSEVALALVLLVGAGLLFRSLLAAKATDPGFAPEHVLSASVSLSGSHYDDGARVRAFYSSLQDRLSSLPGVEAVGIGTDLPLQGSNWYRVFTPDGRRDPGSSAKPPTCQHTVVNADYFKALRIPLKQGRLFESGDRPESTPVIIVNETLAKRYWPNGDAVGKRIKWGAPESNSPFSTIIGVVADVKQQALDQDTEGHTYEFEAQIKEKSMANPLVRMLSIAVRASGTPQSIGANLRTTVWSLDRELPVVNIETMQQSLDKSIRGRSLNTWLLGIFASAALLLAAIGIYGVMAFSVSQRTQEIGIRMALGAHRADVLRMVLTQALWLALLGVAIGLAGSLVASRYIGSLLYGVQPTDLWTFTAVAAFLTGVALFATWLPARRATKIDPMIALRYE